MNPSLTSWRVASSVACGSGNSVSSSHHLDLDEVGETGGAGQAREPYGPLRGGRARGVRQERIAAQVDALELGAATLEVEAADGNRDHVGLRGRKTAGEHLVR